MNRSQQVVFREKQINYKLSGEGPCLVLLHGFLESLKIWDDFADILSNDFKTIVIDLPGHGKTGEFFGHTYHGLHG
ncbi:MAG: hypothetical protein R2764_13875 [Bacteroidales bacterium]